MGKIKFPLIGGHSPFGYGLDEQKPTDKRTTEEERKKNQKQTLSEINETESEKNPVAQTEPGE